jgi:neutral amino acid transport system ATP-binding protein
MLGGLEFILDIRQLVAGYNDARILDGVDLRVDSHEVVSVIGPNGAGKSTLVKALMGLVRVHSGSISFMGEDVVGRSPEEIVRRGIGYVPQVENVFQVLTVRENLDVMFPGRLPRSKRGELFNKVLVLFPSLRDRLQVRAGLLSGGERQMLGLARALVVQPSLMVLDEPTASVAPSLTSIIFDKILEINAAGTPILLVEQNARRALKCSSRGYILEDGRNAITAPSLELLANPEIQRLYLGGRTSTRPDGKSDDLS